MTAPAGTARARDEPQPPPERGATVIADRVVARIATHVAREALTARLGPGRAAAEIAVPRVRVAVRGGNVRLRVGVELPYPVPATDVCRFVRQVVAERVGALTGMTVGEVVVVVERLVPRRGGPTGRLP